MSNARNLANLLGTGTQITTADIADGAFQANKNLIINGAMQVAQRGTSVSVPATTVYGACDRWKVYNSNAGAFDYKQSTDVPSGQGFANSLQVDITTASASPASGHYSILSYRFEGQDLQQLKKGTANAEQFTVSFWVKSSVTGTMAIEMYDVDNTRSCSKTFTVNTADTWEYKTITYPADTTGTFDNDNADSLGLNIWIMAGTDYTSGSVSGTWGTPTSANRASAYNIYSSNSNNLYFTGFQLEVGETATPFEHRSYGDELRRCQRYYWTSYDNVAAGTTGTNSTSLYWVKDGTNSYATFGQTTFPSQLRVAPTAAIYNATTGNTNSATSDGSNFTAQVYYTRKHSMAGGHGGVSVSNATGIHYHMTADAEL